MALLDKDIREPLKLFLAERNGRCRILEEKNMGRSRADMLLITENDIIGIEIKSDADSYARLKRQVPDYDYYYDRNVIVVGSSHALRACEHVPEYWGIVSAEMAEGKFDFYVVREPKDNPHVKLRGKLMLLWRSELAKLQVAFGMPKYRQKSKFFVEGKILEWVENGKIDRAELKRFICTCWLERKYRFGRDAE